jgi:hypothetical protein
MFAEHFLILLILPVLLSELSGPLLFAHENHEVAIEFLLPQCTLLLISLL